MTPGNDAATATEGASTPGVPPRIPAWAARLVLFLPGAAMVGMDVVRRHATLAAYSGKDLAFYVFTVVLSLVLWTTLCAAAAQREGWERWVARVLLVMGATLAVGAQLYTFNRYSFYLNHRSVLFGTSVLESVAQQLWSDRWSFLRAALPPVVLALVLPLVVARVAPLPRMRALFAFDVALIALAVSVFAGAPRGGGEQAATPDVLYLSAMGKLSRALWEKDPAVTNVHPGARTPIPVPQLTPRPASPRNVLFIVNESVRAFETCVAYDPDCATTPFSNALAPLRFPLTQMRSLDSTTAVSLAVMWSGLPVTATRQDFHTAPLLWEYAHAAGYDTAYWTAQHPFFANAGLWLEGVPFTKRITATEIDPDATYELGADDGQLIDVALHDLPEMKEPFVGVVHLSNTHFPYKFDAADAPFQPITSEVGAGAQDPLRNCYRNAIYNQDRHIARLLRELRASRAGPRTVVVYMSDHGEQIRERGAVGHTFSVQEEEIRVATWIDAPPGTLSAAEEAHLRRLHETPLTALDVMPTLLDLIGVHDEAGVRAFRAKMPGTSLLRGGSPEDRAVVLSNCTEIFACALKNWGVIRGTKKILATQHDRRWRCYDVATDPYEQDDLGEEACEDLRGIAEADGRGTPF